MGVFGKHPSQETKDKIRNSLLGRKHPYISHNVKGENNPMFGKHHSEDSKLKIAETRRRLYKEGKIKPNFPMKDKHHTHETIESIRKKMIGLRGVHLTEEELKDLYSQKRLSMAKIAKIKNIHPSTVYKILKRYNIEIRSRSQALSGSNNYFYKNPQIKLGVTFEEAYGKEKAEIMKEKIKENRAIRIVPKKDTSIELKIQDFLKQMGISFFTHKYIREIEHGYQCDILIPSMNMVIECDGNYWHRYPIGNDVDHIRTSELLQKGFKVLRLWESQIRKMNIQDFSGVIKDV